MEKQQVQSLLPHELKITSKSSANLITEQDDLNNGVVRRSVHAINSL